MTTTYSGVSEGPVLIDRQMRAADNGDETVDVYEGTERAIVGKLAAFKADYSKVRIQKNGLYHRAICSTPRLLDGSAAPENKVTTVWALDSNDEQLSLWEHPKVVAALSAMASDTARAKAVEDLEAAIVATTDPEKLPDTVKLVPDLKAFYVLWIQKITHFTTSSFVLRKRQIVARDSSVRPSFANRDRFYSSTSLAASETLDLPILETLLTDLSSGFWQKKTPDVSQESNGRYIIASEWWYADTYDSWIYGTAL